MPLKGNINHSVCRWCYGQIPLETFCAAAAEMGIKSIDLLDPHEWEVAARYGLTCAMAQGAGMGIEQGFNRLEHHDQLVADYQRVIPLVATAGLKNIICFPGNRVGQDDQLGWANCERGIRQLLPLAEQHGVTIVMELLNSKVDHPDYQCDHTAWGVELCQRLGSEHFKLLYDVYHMQIMEGDIIATIRANSQYIAHYHTGGVPGRNEIGRRQEVYYPAVMQAILETGFQGYVAQEFVPTAADPLHSLREAIAICDV